MTRHVEMRARTLPLAFRRVERLKALPVWQRWLAVILDWEDRLVEERVPAEQVVRRLRGERWGRGTGL